MEWVYNIPRRMKEKYNLTRDKRGFYTNSINDQVVRFASKSLSIKVLRKMRLNQAIARVIDAAD